MRKDRSNEGLRKHRPKKMFRFEYIKGKFSHLTKKERAVRKLDEIDGDDLEVDRFAERLRLAKENENKSARE